MAPGDVVRRAADQGVELYALTDHDEVSGLAEAKAAAAERSLAFVPGVEVSVTWGTTTIHVVGLGVDGEDATCAIGSRTCGRGERGARRKSMRAWRRPASTARWKARCGTRRIRG